MSYITQQKGRYENWMDCKFAYSVEAGQRMLLQMRKGYPQAKFRLIERTELVVWDADRDPMNAFGAVSEGDQDDS